MFLAGLLCLFCCKQNEKVFINGKQYSKLPEVPGCVQIDSNYFADKTELRNIDWREYQYWVMRVFGKVKHNETLLDSLCWQKYSNSFPFLTNLVNFHWYYHEHPAYHYHPLVGVSYEQAVEYCKWRTDRVFEGILIEKGIISVNFDQVSKSYFSIENYFNGKYLNIKPDFSIPYVEFRLPTKTEWEQLAYGGLDFVGNPYGIDFSKKYIQEDLTKDSILFRYFHLTPKTLKVKSDTNTLVAIPPMMNKTLKNNFGLYSMHDNVSELVYEKGIFKGGSFNSKMEDSQIYKDFEYEGSNAWLGFRCVAEWKLYKLGK